MLVCEVGWWQPDRGAMLGWSRGEEHRLCSVGAQATLAQPEGERCQQALVQGLCWAVVVPDRFLVGRDSAREVALSCLSWHP